MVQYVLQNEIESLVNSKVKITIDIAEKYNPLQKNVTEYNSLIASLMKELEYTIDVVKNLKKKNICLVFYLRKKLGRF